jgi:hypothetical protein
MFIPILPMKNGYLGETPMVQPELPAEKDRGNPQFETI